MKGERGEDKLEQLWERACLVDDLAIIVGLKVELQEPRAHQVVHLVEQDMFQRGSAGRLAAGEFTLLAHGHDCNWEQTSRRV